MYEVIIPAAPVSPLPTIPVGYPGPDFSPLLAVPARETPSELAAWVGSTRAPLQPRGTRVSAGATFSDWAVGSEPSPQLSWLPRSTLDCEAPCSPPRPPFGSSLLCSKFFSAIHSPPFGEDSLCKNHTMHLSIFQWCQKRQWHNRFVVLTFASPWCRVGMYRGRGQILSAVREQIAAGKAGCGTVPSRSGCGDQVNPNIRFEYRERPPEGAPAYLWGNAARPERAARRTPAGRSARSVARDEQIGARCTGLR